MYSKQDPTYLKIYKKRKRKSSKIFQIFIIQTLLSTISSSQPYPSDIHPDQAEPENEQIKQKLLEINSLRKALSQKSKSTNNEDSQVQPESNVNEQISLSSIRESLKQKLKTISTKPTSNFKEIDFKNLKYTKYDTIDDAKALYKLHDDVDDDDDGSISFTESQYFFEANNKKDVNSVIQNFEADNDGEITFHELWNFWITSKVHNWNTDDLIKWLEHECELPIYSDTFRKKNFTGAILPRLALSDFSFIKILGIRSFIHRRRLMLKAMDAVLYGPPRKRHSVYKDLTVIFACLLAIGTITWSYIIRSRLSTEIDVLSDRLKDQIETNNASISNQPDNLTPSGSIISDNDNLLNLENAKIKIEELENEVQNLNIALAQKSKNAENFIAYEQAPSREFLQLLRECKLAEDRLLKREHETALKMHTEVKQELERLQKKKNTLFGAMQLIHGEGLDSLDQDISNAKQYIEKVAKLKTGAHNRWKKIYLQISSRQSTSSIHHVDSNNAMNAIDAKLVLESKVVKYTKPNNASHNRKIYSESKNNSFQKSDKQNSVVSAQSIRYRNNRTPMVKRVDDGNESRSEIGIKVPNNSGDFINTQMSKQQSNSTLKLTKSISKDKQNAIRKKDSIWLDHGTINNVKPIDYQKAFSEIAEPICQMSQDSESFDSANDESFERQREGMAVRNSVVKNTLTEQQKSIVSSKPCFNKTKSVISQVHDPKMTIQPTLHTSMSSSNIQFSLPTLKDQYLTSSSNSSSILTKNPRTNLFPPARNTVQYQSLRDHSTSLILPRLNKSASSINLSNGDNKSKNKFGSLRNMFKRKSSKKKNKNKPGEITNILEEEESSLRSKAGDENNNYNILKAAAAKGHRINPRLKYSGK